VGGRRWSTNAGRAELESTHSSSPRRGGNIGLGFAIPVEPGPKEQVPIIAAPDVGGRSCELISNQLAPRVIDPGGAARVALIDGCVSLQKSSSEAAVASDRWDRLFALIIPAVTGFADPQA